MLARSSRGHVAPCGLEPLCEGFTEDRIVVDDKNAIGTVLVHGGLPGTTQSLGRSQCHSIRGAVPVGLTFQRPVWAALYSRGSFISSRLAPSVCSIAPQNRQAAKLS